MHERIYNDFLLAEHRLQRVLIQWKLLQPRFTAKKTAVLSPETRSLLILSLKQQHQHVAKALRKLYEVKACWDVYKTVDFCYDRGFFKMARANIKNSLEPQGVKVINRIEIAILEFQTPPKSPIPFNDLPYEFRKRLIQLLPLKDVTTFKSCGNTAFKAVRKLRPSFNFVNSLFVVYFIADVKKKHNIQKNSEKVYAAISETDFLPLKTLPYYIDTNVSIYLSTQEAFSKAIDIVSGDFNSIKIYGRCFTWRQAFELVYKSSCIKRVFIHIDILDMEEDETNEFFNAIMLLLQTENFEHLRFYHSHSLPFLPDFMKWLDNLNSNLGFFVHISDSVSQVTVSKYLLQMTRYMPDYIMESAWFI
uniref:F-box domain-containing protein n=1 Tax=Panagrellus redivivus TaxID=6233 RepID=A0A7E4UV02_PANRE